MGRKEIIGILLIAVVASTILTYHLQKMSDIPLELLEERIPEAIPPGEKSDHELSISLILRQGLESLILDFDSLCNATRKEGNPTIGVEEAIQTCIIFFDEIDCSYVKEDIDVDGAKGVLYDFSEGFSKLAPRLATLSATTVYCIVEIDDRKLAYRGVSDFFPNRNRSLASITLSKNEVPEIYLTMQAGEANAQNKPSVMEAPMLGQMVYNASDEDDRFSTRLVIRSTGVPIHSGIIEVMRIYADDKLQIAHGYFISK